jgi:hypothetical protein
MRQARFRRASLEAASRVNAILNSSKSVLDKLHPRRGGEKINRTALIKAGRRLCKPLLGGGPGAKIDIARVRISANFQVLPV